MKATIYLDPRRNRGPVDNRIYGGFLEHMGRAVYEGVYDPGSPRADTDGIRTDVSDALRELRMPVVRYPGGNYVSGHDWRHGIGPRDQRPRRPDFAWKSIETNQFGTDEFIPWCRSIGAEPMLAVNLGTGTPREAAEYVEYVNLPRGTSYADMRPHDEPYGVKLWCLGNEMDGPWQAGHVPADEYARRAQQAALLMKGLDPTIETVLCGSSGYFMPTYLEYDRVALEYAWNDVDYVSAHRYSENRREDSDWFLAEGMAIERILDDYRGLFAYVRGRKHAKKQVYLSFDEWNVWYKNMEMDGRWSEAPALIEEVYNLEDALVCAQYLAAFIRNADLVKVACFAQLVNIIGPLLTRKDAMVKQTIFHTIRMISEHGRGISLTPLVECDVYNPKEREETPVLDVAATQNGERVELFVINRLGDDVTIALPGYDVVAAEVFGGSDLKETNDWENPDRLRPRSEKGNPIAYGWSLTRLTLKAKA